MLSRTPSSDTTDGANSAGSLEQKSGLAYNRNISAGVRSPVLVDITMQMSAPASMINNRVYRHQGSKQRRAIGSNPAFDFVAQLLRQRGHLFRFLIGNAATDFVTG